MLTMSDLISRQDVIYALLEKGQQSRRYKLGDIWELNFDEIREALAMVPSAYPKKGMWAKIRLTNKDYGARAKECSSCGSTFFNTIRWHYCPNCGADMRGETNE